MNRRGTIRHRKDPFEQYRSDGRAFGHKYGATLKGDDLEQARQLYVREQARRSPIRIWDLVIYTWHSSRCGHKGEAEDYAKGHKDCANCADFAEACTPGKVVYTAMGFMGNQAKPYFHHAYRSAEARDRSIAQYIAARRDQLKAKAKREDEKKKEASTMTSLEVGDILYTSWGYDQTNVDFYRVVAVRGGVVDVQEISAVRSGDGAGSDRVVASASSRGGKIIRGKRQLPAYRGGKAEIKISDRCASLWDGRALYATSAGYGHVAGRTKKRAAKAKPKAKPKARRR